MSLALYMDHQVPSGITRALRARGIDVLTAEDDGTQRLPDPQLLDRATALERVLFTRDEDFLTEAALRQHTGRTFYGVVYAHQLRVPIGQCIKDLEFLCSAGMPADVIDIVWHCPIIR